jgi:predicted DCC family thiol-disulfide oxidoreductase YuxK
VLRWDRGRRLKPVALQTAEAARLLGAMAERERMASWHLVAPDGEVRSAGAAFAPLLRELPGGRAPARVVEWMPGVTARAYGWIARHRSWFGGVITERAKARADALIGERS